MSDLIDRQAAIEALRAMQTYKLFAGDDMLLIDQAGAQTELMMLPPSQLGTNLAEVGTDCISRQAAIDAIDVLCQEHRYKIPGKGETYSQYNEAWQDALDRAEGAIFNLPPTQPEKRTETHGVCLDAISRQAAIEEINKALDRQTLLNCFVRKVAIDAIKQLPPAQPEHIRGHWICDRSWSEGVGMGESYGHYWKCDKCGHLEKSNGGVCGCNFCSNCGSDNREVTT